LNEFDSHSSWQAYCESRNAPLRFGSDATEEEHEEAFRILGAANRHFWAKHLATLSSEVRREIENHKHPSQSHQRHEEAEVMMTAFAQFLDETCRISITEPPRMGFYHGDQIIFTVRFNSEEPWAKIDQEIPPFFQGYRISRTRQSDCERLNQTLN